MLRHFSVHVYHASCTYRIGARNDPSAVVDPKLRLLNKSINVPFVKIAFFTQMINSKTL